MKSKEVKDLMEAYASIYMEQEELVESAEKYAGGQHPSKNPDKKDRKKPAPTDNKKSRPLPTPMGGKTDQLPQRTKENAGNVEYYKDDVDLFDIVKGHLMSEGFADTEEAALAIMANMSEEWRQSIIEERGPHYGLVGVPKKAIDKIPGVRALRTAASNTLHRMDYQHNAKPVQVGDKVVPYYMINPGGYGLGALSAGYRQARRVTNLKSGKSKSMDQITDEI